MNNQEKFTNACIDGNSINELLDGINKKSSDKTDCKEYNISSTEWRKSICDALADSVS